MSRGNAEFYLRVRHKNDSVSFPELFAAMVAAIETASIDGEAGDHEKFVKTGKLWSPHDYDRNGSRDFAYSVQGRDILVSLEKLGVLESFQLRFVPVWHQYWLEFWQRKGDAPKSMKVYFVLDLTKAKKLVGTKHVQAQVALKAYVSKQTCQK